MNFSTQELEFASEQIEITREGKKISEYHGNFLQDTINKIQ